MQKHNQALIRVWWWLLQNALTCASISISIVTTFHRLCVLPVYTAAKKVVVSKDYTLETVFKSLQFQGRQHADVM